MRRTLSLFMAVTMWLPVRPLQRKGEKIYSWLIGCTSLFLQATMVACSCVGCFWAFRFCQGCSNKPWPWYFFRSTLIHMGDVSWYKWALFTSLSTTRGHTLEESTVIQMGGLSPYFSKASRSWIDVTYLACSLADFGGFFWRLFVYVCDWANQAALSANNNAVTMGLIAAPLCSRELCSQDISLDRRLRASHRTWFNVFWYRCSQNSYRIFCFAPEACICNGSKLEFKGDCVSVVGDCLPTFPQICLCNRN